MSSSTRTAAAAAAAAPAPAQAHASVSVSASVPLAVDYANTLSASRGRTSDHLDGWLAEHGMGPGPGAGSGPGARPDPRFEPLRDAIRALIAAAAEQTPYPAPALAAVNAASAAAPQWLELTGEGAAVSHTAPTASPADRLLADIARSAIELMSDDQHAALCACQAPGCVQFFVRTHHRQEFCSGACGNRARAARHYQRRKEQ